VTKFKKKTKKFFLKITIKRMSVIFDIKKQMKMDEIEKKIKKNPKKNQLKEK
jgi:hypothetical protein